MSATHNATGLAGALARAFGREQDGAPEGHQTRGLLSAESTRTTLVAIEDQTAQFNWRTTLLAIAYKLELERPTELMYAILVPFSFLCANTRSHETIPSTILEGLIVMLASAQRFPEERILLIETDRASCVLVAWAHHVLGMSVLVRRVVNGQKKTDIFGNEPEQVIIDLDPKWHNHSSAILMSSDGSQLFKLSVEPDGEYIDSTYRAPAKGLGARHLQRELRGLDGGKGKLGREGMLLSAAIASEFCNQLRIGVGTSPKISETEDLIPYKVPKSDLYEATRFLFNMDSISVEDVQCIESYADLLHGTTLLDTEMGDMPSTMPAILKDIDIVESSWKRLCNACFEVSMFIYAFAHVTNLEQCDELVIVENRHMPPFRGKLSWWRIGSPMAVTVHDCFKIISQLMTGEMNLDFTRTSLVCKGGWSVFLSSITESDPSLVRK